MDLTDMVEEALKKYKNKVIIMDEVPISFILEKLEEWGYTYKPRDISCLADYSDYTHNDLVQMNNKEYIEAIKEAFENFLDKLNGENGVALISETGDCDMAEIHFVPNITKSKLEKLIDKAIDLFDKEGSIWH